MLWVCCAMLIGMMGTALISPLYGIYRTEWDLLPSDITRTYVVYIFGALLGLVALGRLPDKIGYRKLLLASIILTLLGTLLSMVAQGLTTLLVGRFLVGIASSITTSAGLAALHDHVPEHLRPKLPLISSLLVALGFGMGPLIGGLYGQFASRPLFSAYLPTMVCGAIVMIGFCCTVRERFPVRARTYFNARDLIPKLTTPEASKRLDFFLTCGSPLIAFCVFGLYAAMAPLFIEAILHLEGPLISGVSIMAILLVSALTQVLTKQLRHQHLVQIGFVALALSNAALMLNLYLNSAPLFVAGVALTAIGHGTSILGSMKQLNSLASPQNLSSLTSTYWVVGYCGTVLAIVVLGWLADHWGINAAISVFGSTVIALCLALMGAIHLRSKLNAKLHWL